MTYTMDTKGVPLKTLERLKNEGKRLLYVGRNAMYTDLGHYWINIKGNPRKSPAGIEKIGTYSEFAELVSGRKVEDELSSKIPEGLHEYFIDIPRFEDGSAVPNGRYELETIEVNPPIIRGKIDRRQRSFNEYSRRKT